MKNIIILKIASAAFLGMLTGCATIMGQSAAETLNVRSVPDQANVVITDEAGVNVFEGKTPTSLPEVPPVFRLPMGEQFYAISSFCC